MPRSLKSVNAGSQQLQHFTNRDLDPMTGGIRYHAGVELLLRRYGISRGAREDGVQIGAGRDDWNNP